MGRRIKAVQVAVGGDDGAPGEMVDAVMIEQGRIYYYPDGSERHIREIYGVHGFQLDGSHVLVTGDGVETVPAGWKAIHVETLGQQ